MARVVRTYYDDEKTKLREEYYEVDGKKEGEYKSYYEMDNYMKYVIILMT